MSEAKKRILVIDDDEQLRAMLTQALERAGYEVVGAGNGAQGLSLFRTQPADLVITDLIMPVKEGVETLIEFRREFPATPVIAISGGGRGGPTDYLSIARRLGACRTLAKPFSRDEMLLAVRDVLAA
jgi:DNA-binding response OmpR family regulator